MRFSEWFLEDKPGPVGKLEVDAPEPDEEPSPKKWMIWLGIVLGVVCLELTLKWMVDTYSPRHIDQLMFRLGGLMLYIWASYKLRATPNRSNVGWLGGLVDDPFRSSDNFNRWLVILQVIMVPGKLMAYSVVMGWFLFQSSYKRPQK